MVTDRRVHARIAVPLNASLVLPGGREVALPVRDISMGGVFLFTKEPPVGVGTTVTVKIALTQGIKPVTLQAEVARTVVAPPEQGGGILGIALHFLKISTEQTLQLGDLIQRSMLGVGTNGRAFPRIACLLDVRCLTPTERQGVLRDIGEGGVGLQVDAPLPIDSLVTVEVSFDAATMMKLPGQVVSCEQAPNKAGASRLGVKFISLAPSVRKDLQTFLKKLWKRHAEGVVPNKLG